MLVMVLTAACYGVREQLHMVVCAAGGRRFQGAAVRDRVSSSWSLAVEMTTFPIGKATAARKAE